MPTIIVNDLSGKTHEVEMSTGSSLMEELREAGFESVLAICGGSLACGTCHVHVDPAFLDKLPPQSEDEKDLLELSEHLTSESRLSCQIPVTDDLNNMVISLVDVQ